MKYKHLFTDKFYKENPKDELKAQNLAHFNIRIMGTEAEDMLKNISMENLPDERISSKNEEARSIAELNNGADILRRMRKGLDPLNSRVFMQKLFEYEHEIGTEVVKMIKKSGNTVFIETATRFLSKCRQDHSAELMAIFDEIRNTYAQSMMLVVIGFRGDEEAIPWVYGKYFQFKDSKHDEGDRAQGALVALDELFDRFYG